MAFSGLQKTRLGLAAFARGLYGSFAGKTEAVSKDGPSFGVGSVMTNDGIGEAGEVTSDGVGRIGAIQLGFGIGSVMSNQGIGRVGSITNTGVGKVGKI